MTANPADTTVTLKLFTVEIDPENLMMVTRRYRDCD
jgi:hypothetical protein